MNNYQGTPFQRALVEFGSYIGDAHHSGFFDRNYLEGLADQRRNLSAQFGRFFVMVLALSVILLLYSAGIELNWRLASVNINEIKGIREVLIFICASTLLAFTFRMLDFFW